MKKFLIAVIKLYQRYLSPMKSTKCPYYPYLFPIRIGSNREVRCFKGRFFGFLEDSSV